jgi:hypothetical protein
MGAGSSHIDNVFKDLKDPLRLTDQMNSSIDIISLIVTRILSTPDIYDLKNLKKEGVCGDYIVVLKGKLMASTALMPYYTASGEEVVYQSPDRLIQDKESRKRICKEIAESSLTVVAIVVSCLASIQVSTKKREQIVTDNLPKATPVVSGAIRPTPTVIQPTPTVIQPTPTVIQPTPTVIQPTPTVIQPMTGVYPPSAGLYQPPIGAYPQYPGIQPRAPSYPQQPYYQPYAYAPMQGAGYDQTSIDWLLRNNYIQQKSSSQEYEFIDQTVPKTQVFVMNTENSNTQYKDITPGLTADIQFNAIEKSQTFNSLNGRSIILQCLPPITIPNSTRESVLPIRILDATGFVFVAGVLHNGFFRSFTEGKTELLTLPTILFLMFRISQTDIDPQLKEKVLYIIDNKEQRTKNNAIFERGKQDPNMVIQTVNTILSGKVLPFQQPSSQGISPGYYGMMSGKTVTAEYSIPSSAAFSILQTLDIYKTKLASDSCPAMIRVKSLLDEINENRRIRTKYCSDMYWNQTNLGKIYPYTTFQFLCIKDWSSPNTLDNAFNTFCDNMVNVYNDASGYAPRLMAPTTAPIQRDLSGTPVASQSQFGRLDTMRFDSVSYDTLKKEYCSTGEVLGEPEYINAVIQEINTEFKQHISAVLKIIDSLIIVIKDPDTNSFVARLSPEITSRKRSTKDFIMKQKEQAISLISNHYIRVEELYLKGIKNTLQSRIQKGR